MASPPNAARPDADAPAGTGASGTPLAEALLACSTVVAAVLRGRSLDDALEAVAARSRPAVQALSFRALRHWAAARRWQSRLVAREPAADLQVLLGVALALLAPDDADPPPYPEHTLVDQAVVAAARLGPAGRRASRAAATPGVRRSGAAGPGGFVNAVLRRFLRERDLLVAEARADPLARTNLPAWWWQRLRADWGDAAESIAEAGRRRPPLVLRVNRRRCSAAQALEAFTRAGVEAVDLGGFAVHLPRPQPITRLPGFAEGWWSVQDLSSQQAAPRLVGATAARPALAAGARVLDACAAPGGKTAHLLELGDFELTAIDRDPRRLERVRTNLDRLGLRAEVRHADAGEPAAWWDGRPFDAILLDAPCSASGVVRRHPDIPWLRRESDLAALVREQDRLLDALWPVLARGGRLLFATCSVFKDEGIRRIDAFLQRQPAASAARGAPPPEHLLPVADNPTPGKPSGDGFFYALIEKG